MITIGVVDDDGATRTQLVQHLRRYERDNRTPVDIATFADGRDVAAGYRSGFDVLLLDVQMAHVDGFTAAERIRRVDPDVVMIFVTHMDQLATRGYEVDALAYVVKPVNYFSLARVLDRAIKRVQARDEQNVMLAVDGDLVKVRARDVIFLESARNRTIVQALDARYSVVGPLKQFETQLADMPFFRSNSGYLVNLGHVLGMRGADAVMTGGYELRVSRPRRSEFLAALTAYLSSRRA